MLNKGIRLIGVLALARLMPKLRRRFQHRLQSRSQGRGPEGLGHGFGGLREGESRLTLLTPCISSMSKMLA